jgi:hypothetical protein
MKLKDAIRQVEDFKSGSLTARISSLEQSFEGAKRNKCKKLCLSHRLDSALLESAFEVKKLAGQINVVIHTAGILAALPSIRKNSEIIESLSLGAGNTGRSFDLQTNQRIAEFKFINWQGGPETIRQNSLFKDFYELAEAETDKKRYLYVLGLKYPLKFFNGRRSLKGVLSRNIKLASQFRQRYGNRFKVVCEYYQHRKELVSLIDLTDIVPELVGLAKILQGEAM